MRIQLPKKIFEEERLKIIERDFKNKDYNLPTFKFFIDDEAMKNAIARFEKLKTTELAYKVFFEHNKFFALYYWINFIPEELKEK